MREWIVVKLNRAIFPQYFKILQLKDFSGWGKLGRRFAKIISNLCFITHDH